jgi:hypothetical protein
LFQASANEAWQSRVLGSDFPGVDGSRREYVLFEDFTHAKFYRYSLREGIEHQGGRFDGFQHVDGWQPQRLVTATGPNPLPQ